MSAGLHVEKNAKTQDVKDLEPDAQDSSQLVDLSTNLVDSSTNLREDLEVSSTPEPSVDSISSQGGLLRDGKEQHQELDAWIASNSEFINIIWTSTISNSKGDGVKTLELVGEVTNLEDQEEPPSGPKGEVKNRKSICSSIKAECDTKKEALSGEGPIFFLSTCHRSATNASSEVALWAGHLG
jgi:hypothetical protein